jgi:serine/threonine protein kinase
LAEALQEAHRSSVVHGNLKPDNILINARRELVIVSFGLADSRQAVQTRLRRQGDVLGTPAYWSPEQVAGELQAIGPRSDVYSLGVVMYQILTDHLPFEEPPAHMRGGIPGRVPTPPVRYRPDVDPLLSLICLKAMAERPADRYATMADFALALAGFMANAEVVPALLHSPEPRQATSMASTTKATPALRAWGGCAGFWWRHNLRRIGAAAAGLLFLLAVIIFVKVGSAPPSSQLSASKPNAIARIDSKKAAGQTQDKPGRSPAAEQPVENAAKEPLAKGARLHIDRFEKNQDRDRAPTSVPSAPVSSTPALAATSAAPSVVSMGDTKPETKPSPETEHQLTILKPDRKVSPPSVNHNRADSIGKADVTPSEKGDRRQALARPRPDLPQPPKIRFDRELSEFQVAQRRLDSAVRFLSEQRTADRLTALFQRHEDTAKAARDFLFDEEKYPIPEQAGLGWDPIRHTQPGHEEMERLVGESLQAYLALLNAVAPVLGGRVEVTAPHMINPAFAQGVTRVRSYPLASLAHTFDQFLAGIKTLHGRYRRAREVLEAKDAPILEGAPDRPFLKAVVALAEERYADAMKELPRLGGLETHVFRMAADYRMVSWNRAHLCEHGPADRSVAELINAYRIALGISPMIYDRRLHAMAEDYAAEMTKHRFFAHVHPTDESRRTPSLRASRVGYNEGVSECLGPGADLPFVLWVWRSDGGHHRGMILPLFTEMGVGIVGGRVVLDVGEGDDSPVAPLRRDD